jgi:hypothetical protein
LSWYFPDGQWKQLLFASQAWNLPLAQSVQKSGWFANVLYLPGWHLLQVDDPATEYSSDGQSSHVTLFLYTLNLPTAQSKHLVTPAGKGVAQEKTLSVRAGFTYWPGAHSGSAACAAFMSTM